MRILIIGGTGFIGRHRLPLLNGHELILLHRGRTTPPEANGHQSLHLDRKQQKERYAAEDQVRQAGY